MALFKLISHKSRYYDDRHCESSGEIFATDDFDSREDAIREIIKLEKERIVRIEEQRHTDHDLDHYLMYLEQVVYENPETYEEEIRTEISTDHITSIDPEIAVPLAAFKQERATARAKAYQSEVAAKAEAERRKELDTLKQLKEKYEKV